MKMVLELVREGALLAHSDQKYGEFPYVVHLMGVEGVLRRFGLDKEVLLQAAWLHDVLEDTNLYTFEDLERLYGEDVAKIVAAVTEPKGGNRAWRHAQTYPRIRLNEDAVAVKLADRIANMEFGGKTDMYVKEYDEFKQALYLQNQSYPIQQMWDYLDRMVENLRARKASI